MSARPTALQPPRRNPRDLARRAVELSRIAWRGAIAAVQEARRPPEPPEQPDSPPSDVAADRFELVTEYRRHVGRLRATFDEDEAASLAVGGNFEAAGRVELGLLRMFGLEQGSDVVDVGCGSGRLATQLAPFLEGSYLGTDVVPDLLAYARRRSDRPDFRFEIVESLEIPAADASADFVLFFSVLTHLLHEYSWVYLEEAVRVLRPGGAILATFLDFQESGDWEVFMSTVQAMEHRPHHNQFIAREDLRIWAEHLGVSVERFIGRTDPIPIEGTVTYDDGRSATDFATLGQAVAVMRKPG